MNKEQAGNQNRREFVKKVGAAGLAAATLGRTAWAKDSASSSSGKFRIGFVGIGNRGSAHLDLLMGIEGVEIVALCDIDETNLGRAKRWVTEGQNGQGSPPALYGKNETDFVRMCEEQDLDLVANATPWRWHTPISVAAMNNGSHAATEVPAALTVEDCWQLVETSQKTGKHCTMLEQTNYARFNLMVLRMAREGVFGELLNAAGGYVHDLREAKLNPDSADYPRKLWRLAHAIRRNGNLYPTHPIGPIAWWFDLGRGDRLDYLVSMSSNAASLNDYAGRRFGKDSQYAKQKMALGDVNVSLLHTAKGKTVTLYFDTNTPHPHTKELRLQGTKGVFSGNESGVLIDGVADGMKHKKGWDLLSDYKKEYEHPLWVKYGNKKYAKVRGHGGGGAHVQMMWRRLIEALRAGESPDMDVYDAATWSAVLPLSGESVAKRSAAVAFPDFTKGKWKIRVPIDLS